MKNVEIGQVPLTPLTPFIDDAETPIATENLIAFGKSFGTPISYAQEQAGRLIQNMVPVHKTESAQISTSSKSELYLHTETAFHPYKPSHVLLLCMRGDSSAATTFALVDEIIEKLSHYEIEQLQIPQFSTSLDESFRSKGESDFNMTTSILRKIEHSDSWEMTFDWQLMKGLNSEASKILESMRKAVSSSVRDIVLEDRDLLVIDNKKVVHGRKSFQARYDGTDRWLKRLLVIDTMPPKQHINGHTIVTEFRDA